LHVKGVPKERLLVSKRPSTGKDAPPSETVRGFVAGYSVSETDELASGQGELDHYRTRLAEIQAKIDRLRVELRDALGQVEYWRTLAEYRKAMLDERREQHRETPRYSLDEPRS
jgi:hypothetical protein